MPSVNVDAYDVLNAAGEQLQYVNIYDEEFNFLHDVINLALISIDIGDGYVSIDSNDFDLFWMLSDD